MIEQCGLFVEDKSRAEVGGESRFIFKVYERFGGGLSHCATIHRHTLWPGDKWEVYMLRGAVQFMARSIEDGIEKVALYISMIENSGNPSNAVTLMEHIASYEQAHMILMDEYRNAVIEKRRSES